MSAFQIYHNPRCSKSRQTLALLEENGVEPEIILYLENTPDAKELASVISKLGVSVRDVMRKGEDEYKEQNLSNPDLSDNELLAAMVASPKLIERPIVIKGKQAVIGRPPENVLDLI